MQDRVSCDEVVTPASGCRDALGRIWEGSAGSLGELLDGFRPYLLTIAAEELPAPLGRKLGASDLVQDTLIKGYQNFAAFEGKSREELAGWLRRILLNHLCNVVDAYHAEKRDVGREQSVVNGAIVPDDQPTPSKRLLTQEQQLLLEHALSRLPEELRRVLLLRNRENASFTELAQVFSRSETGARKLWARAVRTLQHELKTLETTPS